MRNRILNITLGLAVFFCLASASQAQLTSIPFQKSGSFQVPQAFQNAQLPYPTISSKSAEYQYQNLNQANYRSNLSSRFDERMVPTSSMMQNLYSKENLSEIELAFDFVPKFPTFSVFEAEFPTTNVLNFDNGTWQNNAQYMMNTSGFLDKENTYVNFDFKEKNFNKTQLSKPILQFGYSLFQTQVQSQSYKGPASSDYVLGPGDAVTIRIWGRVEESMDLKIDSTGRIYVPKVGYVGLSGLSLQKANEVLKREFSRFYVNFQLTVTLTQLRTIRVYVIGDVKNPGPYEIPAMSTAFTALYSGSPTKVGSLRKIQVKRNNRVIQTIDLYEYLLKGDRHQDVRLEANDTVFVPSIGDVVKVFGKVKRPGIFELESDTNLYDAVFNYAGGFSVDSFQKRISVHRIVNGENRQIINLEFVNTEDAKKKSKEFLLKNGDRVEILPVTDKIFSYVSTQGQVNRPGYYAFKQGMTLKDALDDSQGVLENAFKDRIQVYRYVSPERKEAMAVSFSKAAQFQLKEWDTIEVLSDKQLFGSGHITIQGTVNKPGTYRYLAGIKIIDVLLQAGLPSEADLTQVEVFRSSRGETPKLMVVNADRILKDPESPDNIELQPEDAVVVRKDPGFKFQKVTLKGEVKFPGVYYMLEHERVSDVIKRAGGFTQRAFIKGLVFERLQVQNTSYMGQLKVFSEEKKKLFYDQSLSANLSDKVYERVLALLQERLYLVNGRLIVNMYPYAAFEKSKNDFEILDGDTITVPVIPNFVQTQGGVVQPMSITFEKDNRASFYINKSGGFSEFADAGQLVVIKADGTLIKSGDVLIEEGDIIYVPEKVKVPVDWLDVLSKISQIAFSFITVYKILQ